MEECRELLTSVAAGLEDLKNLRRRLEVLSSDNEEVREKQRYRTVSYTHLTLPTNREV